MMKNYIAIACVTMLSLTIFDASFAAECKKQKLNVFKHNDVRVQAVIIAQMHERGATDKDVKKTYPEIEKLSKDPRIVEEINILFELDLITNKVNYYVKSMTPDHIGRLRVQAKKAIRAYRDCVRMRTRVNF